MWEQINTDADNDAAVDNTQTVDNFDARLREFIQVHATADDRYELAQYLRACRKPRDITVPNSVSLTCSLDGCLVLSLSSTTSSCVSLCLLLGANAL